MQVANSPMLPPSHSADVTSSAAPGRTASPKNELSQGSFMTLLSAELQNQDPTTPMDPTAFLSQLIQLNDLLSTEQIQASVSKMADSPANASPVSTPPAGALPASASSTSPQSASPAATPLASALPAKTPPVSTPPGGALAASPLPSGAAPASTPPVSATPSGTFPATTPPAGA